MGLFKPEFLAGNEKYIILGAILLVYVGIRVAHLFTSGSKIRSDIAPGSERNYGIAGGTICPKCHRPFRLNFTAIKLGFGYKYARCEFCGKWSLVRRASMDQLREAEQAEIADAQPAQPVHNKSESKKLDEMVDDSRFVDKI
jgi:hypothetical protein